MSLTEREYRQLRDIEVRLARDDPGLARRLSISAIRMGEFRLTVREPSATGLSTALFAMWTVLAVMAALSVAAAGVGQSVVAVVVAAEIVLTLAAIPIVLHRRIRASASRRRTRRAGSGSSLRRR